MKVAISGISGFVGQSLKRYFEAQGDTLIGLKIRDSMDTDELARLIDGCDVLINLSGANILARWSSAYKDLLYKSRIETTKKLVSALGKCDNPPKTFLSASAVGIYASNGSHSEASTNFEDDFLSQLCQVWESHAYEATSDRVRVCTMRFGVIYGKGGGAMSKMLLPFKLGLGGMLGDGKQKVSWIHIDDLVLAIQHLISDQELSGVFNMTAPQIVSNKEQTSILALALHRPAFFKVPSFAIGLIFGEGSKVMLDSKSALPVALEQSGFKFLYPTLDTAIKDIIDAV